MESGRSRSIAQSLCAVFITAYQRYISPVLGPHCRFTPTCSEYALQAIGRHGVLKGIMLGAVRLLKCGPWHPGGEDPVPEEISIRKIFWRR